MEARVGSLTSPPERFLPWRTIEGEKLASATIPQLRVVIEGLFDKQRLLDFLHFFIVRQRSFPRTTICPSSHATNRSSVLVSSIWSGAA